MTHAWTFRAPITVTCPDCDGQGFTHGLTMRIICMECDGFGRIRAGDDPKPLTRDEREAILKQDLMRAQKRVTHLETELASVETFRKQKAAADLANQVYPPEFRHTRGGYGD